MSAGSRPHPVSAPGPISGRGCFPLRKPRNTSGNNVVPPQSAVMEPNPQLTEDGEAKVLHCTPLQVPNPSFPKPHLGGDLTRPAPALR